MKLALAVIISAVVAWQIVKPSPAKAPSAAMRSAPVFCNSRFCKAA